MPYLGQTASGEALISLEQSKIFEEFKGRIRAAPPPRPKLQLTPTVIPAAQEMINTVVAIDGSLVTEIVRNGFPGAEASVLQIALVLIKLDKLVTRKPKEIIPPRVFNNMDTAATLQEVLPGRNIVSESGLGPREFFRHTIHEALQGTIQAGHETLLDTYKDIVKDRKDEFRCPHDGCDRRVSPAFATCACNAGRPIYPTDQMRFHERFNETGPNGEPHGEVMRFLEIILLINTLRYFLANDDAVQLLPKTAFVFDGPLAAFGQYASIAPRVREELVRINEECTRRTGKGIILFSLIKTGQFVEHFEQLDFCPTNGPGQKFHNRSTLLPDIGYIHDAIVFRPPGAKEWGKDTYFGRMVLYKNASGQKMVVNTPRVTPESEELSNTSLAAYPRLGEILEIVDRLSTYLFDGGFVPIVRAHSHAAIPLRTGGELLKRLFDE